MAAEIRGRDGVKLPVREQVSAGGVVFRRDNERIDVVIVAVGGNNRWQLPKGLVEAMRLEASVAAPPPRSVVEAHSSRRSLREEST